MSASSKTLLQAAKGVSSATERHLEIASVHGANRKAPKPPKPVRLVRNETVADEFGSGSALTKGRTLSFEVVVDRAGFEALESEWSDLFERAGKPHQVFQSFNWCWHWCNHFLGDAFKTDAVEQRRLPESFSLFILVARSNGRLVMVWPMERHTTAGVSRLSWLGTPVAQYGDVIIDDVGDKAELLLAGWVHLVKKAQVDVIRLWKVREDGAVAGVLGDAGAVVTCRAVAPYVALGGSPSVDAYFKSKNAKALKNRRRARRRLNEAGEVSFEVLGAGDAARDVTVKALTMKREWLTERGLFSRALNDARTDAFFCDVALGGERCVDSRISKLSVDGRDVAIEIGFACKGALAVHMIVYDHAYNNFGCGSLAMEDSIRACWADGLSTYDLLAPNDPYKLAWADGTIAVNDWCVAVTLKGRIWEWLGLKLGKNGVKRGLDMLPVVIRQPVTRLLGVVFGAIRN